MQEMIRGHLLAGLKAIAWEFIGLLSWSQWAVLILCIVIALSLTVKLPGMLFDLITLRLGRKMEGKRYTAAVAVLSMAAGFFLATQWQSAPAAPPPPPQPPREIVVYKDRPVPVLPDLSKIKWPDLSALLSKIKLPELPKEDPEAARLAEEARLAELEKQKAAEAKRKALARKALIRQRNAEASATMDVYMYQGMTEAEREWEIQQRRNAELMNRMSQPRHMVLPPGSRMVR